MTACNQALTMITQDAFTVGKMVINSVLSKMNFLSKSQSGFILDILLLFLSLRGHHYFIQMSREGNRNEKSCRYQSEKEFNWISFNDNLVKQNSSRDLVIGFDLSYIRKSGLRRKRMCCGYPLLQVVFSIPTLLNSLEFQSTYVFVRFK